MIQGRARLRLKMKIHPVRHKIQQSTETKPKKTTKNKEKLKTHTKQPVIPRPVEMKLKKWR